MVSRGRLGWNYFSYVFLSVIFLATVLFVGGFLGNLPVYAGSEPEAATVVQEKSSCTLTVDSNTVQLPFFVTDAVLDPDKPVVYITCKAEKKLYAVDYTTGDTSSMTFTEMPESLELGKGDYVNELYVALLSQEHSSSWKQDEQTGKIAVISRDSSSLLDTIDINVDPFDIVAGRDGCLYVPSGSGGVWTCLDSYNRSTKQRVGRTGIYELNCARLHPSLERIYTLDADNYRYRAYNISNGSFLEPASPGGYLGNYDDRLNDFFEIDPTGNHIFNSSGTIYSSTTAKASDMKYVAQMADPFEGIIFESDGSRFFTLPTSEDAVYVYDAASRNKIGSFTITGKGKFIFRQGEKLVILGASNTYNLQAIDLSALVKTVSLTTNPAQPQMVGTPITLTAEATGGTDPEYAFLVKEAADDWVVLQNWSSADTCTWIPKIGGTAVLMVQARSGGAVGTKVFTSMDYMVNPGGALSGAWNMPSSITDIIVDPANPMVYMTSITERKLYAVNYDTGDTIIIGFQEMPEHLEMGNGECANELYLALLSHKHDSYWDDDEQYGAIAVLDKNNLHLIDKLDIQVDPFDIIAGRDGYLYVPSGSGQWANFDSYNRSTKQRVGRVTIRQQSYARLHPNLERIYTIDTENRGYKAYNISKGNFLEPAHPGGYDSPYQGDYSLDTYFSLDPTGKYLFNGGGVIFNTTTDKENDMTYANKGIDPFTGIAFDQDGSRYYTLPKDTNSVNIYDAVSFQKIGDFNINGIGKYIFKSGSNLVILSETTDTSNKYKIQVIDLTKLVHSISLSVSPDQPQAVGTPITLSAEATGGVIPEYYFSVKEGGGHWEIIQAWSSANTCTWTPKMGGTAEIMVEARSSEAIGTRVYAYREYVVIPEAAIPGVWKIPAEITDTIIDPVNPVIYMISKTDKKLYSVNYITGDSMVTGFQYMPECLEFGQGEYSNELYVAFPTQEHDMYWSADDQTGKIAVINKDNLDLIDTIDISIDPFDLVSGRDGYLYVTSGSGQSSNIDSYNRSTKQRMGRASIIRQSLARLHPILNRVYVIRTVFTANYGAYNILNGSFVDSEGYNAPYDNHDLNTYFAIDPSGKYLFNGSGVIRSSTEDKENDMKYITQLADPFNGMVFEDDGSKFYTVPTNENAVFIYDYSSLTKIGSIPLNINGKYLFKQGETFIIIGQASSSSIYCVQVIDLSALAQSVSLSVSPEQPQGVGTPITLSAEATGGVNLEYNFSVKEAGDDWKTLQSWSNVSTCIWAPKIGGTAILMVKARSGGSVGGIEVFTSKNYEVIPAGALPGTWKMPQDVTDAIIDPVNPIMYMTSKIEKKLYAVNYKTGDTIITAFQDMPESLEFGKGEYANELYVALLSRDHSPYWRNEDQSGKIAVINKENLQLIDTIDIGVDPFDLVAGRDGCLYVSSGSGQWTYFDSYNRSSKQRVGRVTIRQESYTRLHPILERIYTINTDTKWPDYHGYNISNGNFLDQGYASPYHEYYPLNTYFTMDPAGQYLFNGSGTIFATAVEKENDMKYVATLADSFIGLVFEDGPRFFTIPGGQTAIYAYNAGNRIRTDAIPLQGYGKFVFRKGDELITIVKTADSVKPYIIQDIKTLESDLTTAITSCSPQTAPGDKLEVTVQVANQNQVKNVTAFQIHYMLGDRELGSKRTSKLNCNKSITVKMKLSIPADVSYGTQILKVIVGQSSKENYVFNSVATSEVRIVHPDLVINSVTSKKAVIPGKANNIAANISNITVASAGEFKIKVYNGETATVLGEKSVVSLKKQKSKSVTIKVKLPTNFNSDTDYLRVVVDADQQITEEDENNNMCYYLKK